jgi:PAS domain S-box-containing protein
METTRLLDAIDDVFYVCTETGALRRWNERLCDQTGYADEELSSMTLQECFEAAEQTRVETALQEACETGEAKWRARVETSDGTTIPFECTATVREDSEGAVLLTGTGRPLSDHPGPSRSGPDETTIRRMHRLVTEQSLDTDQRLERLLELGRERLDVSYGFVSTIDESSGQLTVTATTSDALLPEGTQMDLSATLCERTIEHAGIVEFGPSDALSEGALLTDDEDANEMYVGGRIVVDGTIYATVCFVGCGSHEEALTASERVFVRKLRRSIRHLLSQEHRQNRLERAIEAAPIGISIASLEEDGQPLTYVNEGFEELTGYSESEILGTRCCSLQGEGTDPETARRIQRAIEAHETETVEILNYRKEGTPFWNRVSVAPLEDESGEIHEFVAFQEDVTERTEREQKLRESQRQFEAVFNDPEAFVGLADTDGTVYRVNEPALSLVDVEHDEIVGTPAWETPWWNHDEQLKADIEDSVERAAEGEYVELEADLSALVPGELIVSGTIRPVTDDDGEVVSLIMSARDVTEPRRRERELRETNEQLNAIIEASSAALIAIDEDDVVELWNPAAERIFGWSDEVVVGETLPIIPEESSETTAHARDVARDPSAASFEATRQCKDGSLVDVRVSAATLRDSDGSVTGYLCALQDVSERTAYEQQLERYRTFTDDLLDAVDDIFYVLDEDGYFERWNETLCSVTGYSDEELASMREIELFDESDREHIKSAVTEVFKTGSARAEVPLVTKDGESIPYEFTASAVEHPDGETRLTGIGRDISDRLTAERKLRERERELTTLMNNIPGMVYRCANEPDWPMEFVSAGCAELTGYDAETLQSGAVSWGGDVIHEGHSEIWEAVQEALEDRRPFRVTYPIETADGERRWCKEQGRGVFDEDGSLEALEGVIIDITERKERQQALECTQTLLQQAQRLASVGGCVIPVEDGRPRTITWETDVADLLDLTPGSEITFEDAIESIVQEDRDRVRERVLESIQSCDGFDLEFRLETDERDRWLRAIGEPVVDDATVDSVRVAIQEVTDRKRHQLALESIQEATRGLLGTESRAEIATLVGTVAVQVLDVDGAAIYGLETERGAFDPLSTAGSFDELYGETPVISVENAESLVWEAFASGETTIPGQTTDRHSSVLFDDSLDGILVPIGEHGVFVAAARSGPVDESTTQLVETLVAAAEAAFDRLEHEATLRERDAELEARNDRLQRQVQINDIIRSINKSLIRASSRDDVETAVCDRLVADADIEFAWIGDLDSSGHLEPRTWAGTHPEYLDDIPLDGTAQHSEPAYITAMTGESTVVENVLDEVQAVHWRKRALLFNFRSVVCVPLTYDEYTYGVLAVYAEAGGAFGTLEETVFRELGETIANSINAVETRRGLQADTALELTLAFDAPETFCHRLAAELDCRIVYDGLGTDDSDRTRLFFSAPECQADSVERVLEDLLSVSAYSGVGNEDDGRMFVATITSPTIASRINRHGGRLRSMEATPDGLDTRVELPPETNVREFVSIFREQFGPVELISRQTVERERATIRDHVTSLMTSITERQREVLRTAYLSGFFEWPRESTGEEIAEYLDVSQPTVNRHLRLAQQRLFQQLFVQDQVYDN